MAIYGCFWLCVTMYDHDHVWLYMTMNDYLLLNMPIMAMHGYVWLCMPMYDYVWLCLTMYNYVRLCLTMYVRQKSWKEDKGGEIKQETGGVSMVTILCRS